MYTGFPDPAIKFANELLKIPNDTLIYKNMLRWAYYLTGNFEEAEKGVLQKYSPNQLKAGR